MSREENWLQHRKKINIVVDNDSWILPFAYNLAENMSSLDHDVKFCRSYDEISSGNISFLLGCVGLAPANALAKCDFNLVVHESSLPQGRGFAPLTWQILDGKDEIEICLLEAVDGPADSGPVYLRDKIRLEGHELCDDIRKMQGRKTQEICMRFLQQNECPKALPQEGNSTQYPRRRPKDSELDIDKTIREQFNLLRVVDNQRYPAFFEVAGHKYILRITKAEDER